MAYTSLMSRAEDLAALEVLLESNPPLEETDDEGWTALCYAVGRFGGTPDCAERLLAAGADPNHRTTSGESVVDVLYKGVSDGSEHGRAKRVERILRRHGFRGDLWWSWSHEGTQHSVEICKGELRWRGRPGRGEEIQRNHEFEVLGPLYPLCPEADRALCEHFGLSGPLEVHAPAERRLLAACLKGDVDGARAAIAAGASVETRGTAGDTALILALRHGRARVARSLLESGADVTAKGRGGRVALYWALMRDHHSTVIGELLCAGAPHDSRDAAGRTPLHWAVDLAGPDLESIGWLLSAGASIEAPDNEGKTPLMLARTENVRQRLKKGA